MIMPFSLLSIIILLRFISSEYFEGVLYRKWAKYDVTLTVESASLKRWIIRAASCIHGLFFGADYRLAIIVIST